MTVDNLTLEVTRRCNMNCAHCLRGDAQNLDMNKEIVDKVLEDIECINQVFFTGGEPSLNIPIMDYFFEQAIKKGITIGSFGLVTNGKEKQRELVDFIAEHISDIEDMEYCYVALSRDQYHDPVDKNLLKAFSFYSDDKEQNFGKKRGLLAEGRAADIDNAKPERVWNNELDVEEWENTVYVQDMLYISANGNVLSGCDFSYDHGDQISLGNLFEDSLLKIVKREAKQEVA